MYKVLTQTSGHRRSGGEVCMCVSMCVSLPPQCISESTLILADTGQEGPLREPGLSARAPPAQIFIQDVFFTREKEACRRLTRSRWKKSFSEMQRLTGHTGKSAHLSAEVDRWANPDQGVDSHPSALQYNISISVNWQNGPFSSHWYT